MVVVAISGMPGCGSTTVGKLVSNKLGIGFFSVGDYTKDQALDVSNARAAAQRTVDFWRSEKGSSREFHHASDAYQVSLAKKGNVVIDGKIAVHMLNNIADVKVWLEAPIDKRSVRYAQREAITQDAAKRLIEEKERLERDNFMRIYGIDYFDQKNAADIVINTADLPPEQIAEKIIEKIK